MEIIRWYLSYILTVNFIDGENHQPTENHKLYNIKLYKVHLATAGFKIATLAVISLIA
jgi:hypothetical protein